MSHTAAGAFGLGGRIPTLACTLLFLAACSGSPPEDVGPADDGLRPCPNTPNCVHTGDEHPPEVQPLLLTGGWVERPDAEIWDAVAGAVAALSGTEVVTRTDRYLHAESTSRVFRFVDDLEIYREPGDDELIVRSASRVGRSDLGVNMRRVEALRQALQEGGMVR